jgi:hypothetical protein
VYCTAQCTPSTSCTSRNFKKDTPHSTGGLGGSLLVQHCIEVCCCFHLESRSRPNLSCSQHATVASHVGMQQSIALHQRRPAFAQHAHWTRKTCVCVCILHGQWCAGRRSHQLTFLLLLAASVQSSTTQSRTLLTPAWLATEGHQEGYALHATGIAGGRGRSRRPLAIAYRLG